MSGFPICEHTEAELSDLHTHLIKYLLRGAKSEEGLSPAEQRLAWDIVKYHKIEDVSPDAPVNDLARKLPFTSVDQEV